MKQRRDVYIYYNGAHISKHFTTAKEKSGVGQFYYIYQKFYPELKKIRSWSVVEPTNYTCILV